MSEQVAFDVNDDTIPTDQWAALRSQQLAGKEPTVEVKAEEAPAPVKDEAKSPEGEEPSKEAEQEKKGPDRDEQGKFKAKEAKIEFSPEQQAAFDKAFSRREAKLRREYEARIAEISTTKGTEPVKTETSTAAPKRPELPKLLEYKGTIEEFDKEVSEYPAKLAAYLDSERQQKEHASSIQKRINESEAKALKAHSDYKEVYEALTEDVKSKDEPELPQHVIKAIAEESEDPYELTYYLAKNRDEFRRFAELRPNQVLREVVKLDTRLALQAQAPPAPVKEAKPAKPAPPAPVGARAATSGFDVNDDSLTPDEWRRQREKQLYGRSR
jgi:hypothetical protein